jgi:hypothetical protein
LHLLLLLNKLVLLLHLFLILSIGVGESTW